MCLRQLGWTWPHHTTFVTANGHEVDLRQICPRDVEAQATVGQRVGAVVRVGGQRRTEGAAPVPLAGTCDTGKQTSPTSTARGACEQGGFGCDTSGVVDARGSEQGGNRGAPDLSEVWTSCAGLGAASIVGMSSDSSASAKDRDWRRTQLGREA